MVRFAFPRHAKAMNRLACRRALRAGGSIPLFRSEIERHHRGLRP